MISPRSIFSSMKWTVIPWSRLLNKAHLMLSNPLFSGSRPGWMLMIPVLNLSIIFFLRSELLRWCQDLRDQSRHAVSPRKESQIFCKYLLSESNNNPLHLSWRCLFSIRDVSMVQQSLDWLYNYWRSAPSESHWSSGVPCHRSADLFPLIRSSDVWSSPDPEDQTVSVVRENRRSSMTPDRFLAV